MIGTLTDALWQPLKQVLGKQQIREQCQPTQLHRQLLQPLTHPGTPAAADCLAPADRQKVKGQQVGDKASPTLTYRGQR